MARIFKKSRLLGAVLNLLGLTVAFTAFMVIMIQVLHDWRYDRNYPGSDRTFRLEFVYDPSSPGAGVALRGFVPRRGRGHGADRDATKLEGRLSQPCGLAARRIG